MRLLIVVLLSTLNSIPKQYFGTHEPVWSSLKQLPYNLENIVKSQVTALQRGSVFSFCELRRSKMNPNVWMDGLNGQSLIGEIKQKCSLFFSELTFCAYFFQH